MQRTKLTGMILGLLLFCCGATSVTSESDELRERAKAMRKEASVMAERGNKDQAERLERESIKLLEAAEQLEVKAKVHGEGRDRPEIDGQMRQLKERLQDLLAKERKLREAKASENELVELREQIVGTERELHQIHAGQSEQHPEFGAQAEKLEAVVRSIHHLRAAAENLKMADLHDAAHELMKNAEKMERDVQEAKSRLAAEMQKAHIGEHLPEVVQQMRAEIERLRGEVRELRQKVEKH